MQTMHLFAGVGGGLLADLILGHEPVCAVEIDHDACGILRGMVSAGWFPKLAVLQTHIEDRPILGGTATVSGFDPADWKGRVDILHAGFPCQDISLAGKGAGIHGKRSGLYREVIRCAEVIRPSWILLENVPAIRSRGRHIVIADLVALGYSWRDGILAAADVGAPHRRARWWCLARRTDSDCPRELQSERTFPDQWRRSGDVGEGVADPMRSGLEIGPPVQLDEQGSCAVPAGSGWWDVEPAVGRVADGVPNREHRLRGLGNAQVPLCAAAAWRLLGGP